MGARIVAGIKRLLGAGLLAGICLQAQGAGFQLFEQSVSGLGNAFAGTAASAEDASTIFFNPAGLTYLSGTHALAAVHLIAPQAEFNDKGSSASAVNFLGNTALLGSDGGDAGVTGVVPNLYLAHQLTNSVHLGLGINAPFGLKTDYSPTWKGRYHTIRSQLKIVNVNPALAYKLNKMFSIGLGVNAQYAEAELTNALDLGPTIPPVLGGPLPSQALDGRQQLKGDDWAWGYNAGVLMEPRPGTRFGLSYRSHTDYQIEGNVKIVTPASTTRTSASADLDLPETVSLSGYHELSLQWVLLADISWTKWDRLDELVVKSTTGTQILTLDWNNTFKYSVGLNYKPHHHWILRGGLSYDETPIPGASKRTPRIPGNDRTWLTFGVSHIPNKNFRFDAAYAHLFIPDPDVNTTIIDGASGTAFNLSGSYDASVDIFSAQASWMF